MKDFWATEMEVSSRKKIVFIAKRVSGEKKYLLFSPERAMATKGVMPFNFR